MHRGWQPSGHANKQQNPHGLDDRRRVRSKAVGKFGITRRISLRRFWENEWCLCLRSAGWNSWRRYVSLQFVCKHAGGDNRAYLHVWRANSYVTLKDQGDRQGRVANPPSANTHSPLNSARAARPDLGLEDSCHAHTASRGRVGLLGSGRGFPVDRPGMHGPR